MGIVTSEMIEDRGEIPLTEAVDKFTVQIALVFAVYLATYLLSDGVSILLEKATFLGSFADTVITLIWGFNFLIGSSLALLLKFILSKLRKTKIMSHQYQNNYMLNRISGLAFDFMIVAGITSITLSDLADLWIPLLAITTVGGILTIVYLRFISKRIYRHYENEGFFAMYGMMTGTVSTGIMLLREIDPNFQPCCRQFDPWEFHCDFDGFPFAVDGRYGTKLNGNVVCDYRNLYRVFFTAELPDAA